MSSSTENLVVACSACHKKNRIAKGRLADKPKCGVCKAEVISGQPVDLTLNNYKQHLTSDLPVLVDFWAPWCMPCQQFAPFFAEVAPKFAGKAIFAKINTQNENVLGDRYAIRSIPTLAVFYKDQEIARRAGALPPAQLEQWLEGVLNNLKA